MSENDGGSGVTGEAARPSIQQLRSLLREQHGRDLAAGTQTCRRCGLVQPFDEFDYRVAQNCLLRDCKTCVAKQANSRYSRRTPRRRA